MIGRVFHRLTVLSKNPRGSGGGWLCRCECGNLKVAPNHKLLNDRLKSCGCFRTDSCRTINLKHSGYKTPEFIIWKSLVSRATKINVSGYNVCERWKSSFVNFLEDMGPRPSDRHWMRRKSFAKGFNKDNCHWMPIKPKDNQDNKENVPIESIGITA